MLYACILVDKFSYSRSNQEGTQEYNDCFHELTKYKEKYEVEGFCTISFTRVVYEPTT